MRNVDVKSITNFSLGDNLMMPKMFHGASLCVNNPPQSQAMASIRRPGLGRPLMMPMNDSLGESIRVAFERMPASSSSSWDGLMKTRCRAEGGRPRVGALRGAGSSSLSLLIRLCAGGAVRVAAASERCGGVGGGRGCGGAEGLAGTDVESSLGAVRPGQDASEHQGFMPGFRPSQPPHSRQMDSSLEISEVAFPCIIVLRWRKTLSRGWRPNSKSWLRTHARRIDRQTQTDRAEPTQEGFGEKRCFGETPS